MFILENIILILFTLLLPIKQLTPKVSVLQHRDKVSSKLHFGFPIISIKCYNILTETFYVLSSNIFLSVGIEYKQIQSLLIEFLFYRYNLILVLFLIEKQPFQILFVMLLLSTYSVDKVFGKFLVLLLIGTYLFFNVNILCIIVVGNFVKGFCEVSTHILQRFHIKSLSFCFHSFDVSSLNIGNLVRQIDDILFICISQILSSL